MTVRKCCSVSCREQCRQTVGVWSTFNKPRVGRISCTAKGSSRTSFRAVNEVSTNHLQKAHLQLKHHAIPSNPKPNLIKLPAKFVPWHSTPLMGLFRKRLKTKKACCVQKHGQLLRTAPAPLKLRLQINRISVRRRSHHAKSSTTLHQAPL
jgi:hypothetical protein